MAEISAKPRLKEKIARQRDRRAAWQTVQGATVPDHKVEETCLCEAEVLTRALEKIADDFLIQRKGKSQRFAKIVPMHANAHCAVEIDHWIDKGGQDERPDQNLSFTPP